MPNVAELSYSQFLSPRYLPTWVLLLFVRTVAFLPFRAQLAVGKLLGKLAFNLMPKRLRIARTNLEICFPELDAEERGALLKKHFEALGMSFVEMGIGWYTPIPQLRRITKINGRHYLEDAVRAGNGVLLVCAHFTTLEVGVAHLEAVEARCACMYREQRNKMIDVMIRRGRQRFAEVQIPRDNVRLLIQKLKQGFIVAYMPDQVYVGNQSALLPFFGESAVANLATSKIAKISGCAVLPCFCRRLEGAEGYEIDIGPPIDEFPTADPVEDTRKLVALLEQQIRKAKDQYIWTYKKFKRRPDGYIDVYAEDG